MNVQSDFNFVCFLYILHVVTMIYVWVESPLSMTSLGEVFSFLQLILLMSFLQLILLMDPPYLRDINYVQILMFETDGVRIGHISQNGMIGGRADH